MRLFIQIIGALCTIVVIFLSDILVRYITPAPFNQINIIFIYLTWLLFFNSKNQVLWRGLLLSFLTEFFSASPFGFETGTLLITLVALQWTLRTIFTSRSWYIVFIVTALGLFGWRLLFFGSLVVMHILFPSFSSVSTVPLFSMFSEALLNAVVATAIYGLSIFIMKRFKPKYRISG